MARDPEWAAYWQRLYAVDVARDPRKLPRQWLDIAFGLIPPPLQPKTLTHAITDLFRRARRSG